MLKEKFNDYVQSLETYIMFQIKQRQIELTEELTAKGRKPIPLSMGAPVDMIPQFAVDTLKSILDEPSIHTYSSPKGEKYFLEAVSKRMKKRFNVDVCPENEIFSLIGSKEGIANLIRELINPVADEKEKDIILCPNPGYASYKEMVKVSGGLCYGLEMTLENNYTPNLDKELSRLIEEGYNPKKIKALIINYPNNPLGATCTLEYMQKCVDFCLKHNIILISDNAYCEIYFDEKDKPHSILECKNAKDIAVEFHSFSKPYAMTGWRLGWVCGNSEIVSMFGKLKSTIDTGIFKALQLTGAKLLNSKEGDEYIQCANKKLKAKIQKFTDGLIQLGYDVKMPKAAFYLWMKIPPRYDGNSKKFADDLLEKSGIVLVPGEAFGSLGKGWVRISVVASEEDLSSVIERMKIDGFEY
ncbi:MAG: aminotransferase class I/II-fold pyridoxal phosphate-dependent enzyme [Candidatus Gastranaerophilales bacterium]|nr:aminotransferase class I/II-fold pyridoxal phosphate-dependent enzyme [Candidatus Gastranaerophilales bacterium]